jgi:DNA-binding winged helix-turn-helix (wHTH) protein/TolB-like protein
MEAPVLPKRVYRFGLFQVDPDGGKLLRQGVPVRLQEQPLRVLCLLLERRGEVVSREELRQSLWPEGTYVEFDGSLNAALKRLRFALGDDAENPIFVETVPKRGYRFIAPVERQQSPEITETATAPAMGKSPASQTAGARSSSRLHLRWWMVATTAVVFLAVGWRYASRSRLVPAETHKVIAVLPFSNEGAGPDFDYLRYAIANDLVTDLTYAHFVTVRPFASTSKYGSQPADPETVGRELRVTHVVAGGFLLDKDKQNLRVNLELVDVAQNQPVWREELTVSPKELVALHDKLALRTAKGLLPSINVVGASASDVPSPRNEQALELFLHSLSIPLDPQPNLLAIQKLEESVALDGNYAPAWRELSRRYYMDYHYGNGGEAAAAKAIAADKRQSEIDPSWPAVSTVTRVERGDLNGAYDQATELLKRHLDVESSHAQMSVVLRYAGLLDAANKECDAAVALDPGYNGFRFCAMPLILRGDYARAQTYIRLDEHSGFGAMLRMMIALRTGDSRTALAESNAAAQGGFRFAELAHMQLSHAPEAEIRRAAGELEAEPRSLRDPEMLYFNASVLSFCEQSDAALRQLRKAITGNYCSYPAMDKDPLFDPIRQRPEFAELRQAAIQCQQSFLAHRQQVDATLQASRVEPSFAGPGR